MFTAFHQLGTGKKSYRNYVLTDIGSVHSGAVPSESGTKAFFHSAVSSYWSNELEDAADDKEKTAVYRRQNRKFIGKNGFKPEIDSPEELNTLLRRTLMDGFALAVTVWSIAYGQVPSSNNLYRKVVSDRWHNPVITEAFNTLYEISDLSIAKMQKIADDLAKEFSLAGAAALPFKSVETYGRESEFKFDVKLTIEEEIQQVRFKETEKKSMLLEYGYLAEQFNVSGMFNPAVRCKSFIKRLHLPENSVMQPIINAYSNGNIWVNSIYYAPDDALTGNRVTDFEKYIPRTLDYDLSNNKLDDAGIDELLALGAEIDREQNQQSVPGWMVLPYPQDIVKIDGQWKLQPFFLNNMMIHELFSMEEYFKMLCGRKNALTVQNWIDLINYDHGVGILYNLIPQDMVRKAAELLNTKKSDNVPYTSNLIKELHKTKKFGKYL